MEITSNHSLRSHTSNEKGVSFDVVAEVSKFTNQFFNEMTPSQLIILNKRILNLICKDESFLPLPEKLVKICSNIVVSSKSVWQPEVQLKTDNQYLVYNILRGNAPPLNEITKNTELLLAILWEPNLELLSEARTLIKNLLSDMHRQFASEELTSTDRFHLEMIMGDLLSLYPFLKPEDEEVIQLPVQIEGVYNLVKYNTNRLELTPDLLSSPLVAYGLTPTDLRAAPILLFKGTTYPSDEGAFLSLMTDLNPFAAVGKYAFEMGKKKIQNWLEIQVSTTKTIVYGKSLGGALSWRSALHFPEKIGKVMAYGSPGFSFLERDHLYLVGDKYPELEINFFCQRNDPVPFSDCVAEKFVKYYQVLSANCQKNALAAHADMYSTHESSIILKMHPDYIEAVGKRVLVTTLRLAASVLFPLGCIGVLVNGTYRSIKYLGEETVNYFQSF